MSFPNPPACPPDLPISAHAGEIAAALRAHPVVIVSGDTGSGKTTQLPVIALAAGRGRRGLIGCTQPRRLAALAMARRVAEAFGQEPGGFVGYHHRFDRRLAPDTVVKFMTDGILLAETRRDRLFRAYDTLILDEAHERSLNIDFLLGLIRRILPRRPDLRVIISSATLDVERFAAFFAPAPVIAVPGRLHPIETRWRPPAETEEADLPRQIADACDELIAAGPGDILVFLPGERDIRDTAELLTGRRLPQTEIIPLLASLPAGEQQRAFRLSPNRRIILSTNVAETSLTLPGIRYVVDSGLVRLSRYHARTQVQRLQIEPVSRASANQRRGRCGRLAPGICVRLYGEEDFRRRDAFTPPEIQRTSLAGVLLTMLDLNLGEIEAFPFLDPPSPAMIRDGYRELDMIGALEVVESQVGTPPRGVRESMPETVGRFGEPSLPDNPNSRVTSTLELQNPRTSELSPYRLTPLGRRLARLPIEPAYARMLLAAHQEKALADALIVVASLECDDPRQRPLGKQAEADRAHARFLSPLSDFAARIRLWRWYREQTARASHTAARRLCKAHYLSYPRMRDWIELRDQLERLCQTLQLDTASCAGGDAGLHRALLAGLLGNIGKLDPETREYRGARGIHFALFPGSGLAKAKDPVRAAPAQTPRAKPLSREWVMAGELVDTSRLYARTAARIDPAWIEPAARHLCKSSFHSAAWDPVRGFVRVSERVTLFGLVLVEGRTRDYSRINPADARELFIREGLVAGSFPQPVPAFLQANLARSRALQDAEAKTRQYGALFDPETAYAFYDARLPADLCNAAALRQWLARQPEASGTLTLRDADLPPARDLSQEFPDAILLGGNRLALTYRHAPGEPDDGITCRVPVPLLPLAGAWSSDWLVPGALDGKLRWMVSVLPSKIRRLLLPLDETLAMCRSRLIPGRGPLAIAFADALYAARGVRVPSGIWREEVVPDPLRMRFAVVDEQGVTIGTGRNLQTLTALFAQDAARPAAAAPPAGPWHRDGLTDWDFGDLPAQVDIGKAGWPVIHFPALTDSGDTVSLRLFADPAAAAAAHEQGLVRLFAIVLGKEGKRVLQPLSLPKAAALAAGQLDRSPATLGREAGTAALRETFTAGQPAVRDGRAFRERLETERHRLYGLHAARSRQVVAILCAVSETEALLRATPLTPAASDDLRDQLAWLVFPGFAEALSSARLERLPCYLEACRVRIQRAAGNPAADSRRQAEIEPFWQQYTRHALLDAPPRHDRLLLEEYRWMVEEFRVSLFAQELRTPAPVSAKRLAALWERVFA
ncbi:MAG: DUF3418 domain-containing protein [Kiritimatiellia bacterium]|jgi:ATP-dependent helicase HrpA|nr:DUF3418 domain-containing protein [Kiritimatiellia bacterium]